ncbi:MAG TPA: hydrogenase expression protein HupH [Candidatus Methanomethylia archaeon]|nr:hydrogenase expression protein HupH [Candidatus Methanomethylicia archaeon]
MKILVILPILKHEVYEEITYRELEQVASKDTEIHVASLEKGPASIESAYDEALAVPGILELVAKAEKKGFDAVIIDCMGDPGLEPAREIVDIPVVGSCQASLAIASTLGQKFSVVTALKSMTPLFHDLVRKYGYSTNFASVRSIEVPVLDLEKQWNEVKEALAREGRAAIEQDGADVIVLGCTGMIGMAKELQETLKVPVVDPAPAALKLAELLVTLKLSQSKLVYPKPPEKVRVT